MIFNIMDALYLIYSIDLRYEDPDDDKLPELDYMTLI